MSFPHLKMIARISTIYQIFKLTVINYSIFWRSTVKFDCGGGYVLNLEMGPDPTRPELTFDPQ